MNLKEKRIATGCLLLASIFVASCSIEGSMRSTFGLPTIAEEGRLLKASLSPDLHLAVVALRNSDGIGLPRLGFGTRLASQIAGTSREKLGIKATSLDHDSDSDWALELARFDESENKAQGHSAFFREQGFDGFIVIALREEPQYSRPVGLKFDVTMRYQPNYRITLLTPAGDTRRLLASSDTSVVRCALNTPKGIEIRILGPTTAENVSISNPQSCARRIDEHYRKELKRRLAG